MEAALTGWLSLSTDPFKPGRVQLSVCRDFDQCDITPQPRRRHCEERSDEAIQSP
jgi:hypothetical protein